jgi:glycolate oxidase iron-sulfur subunit
LITENNGLNLIEMTQPDVCCVMGGRFNLHYYEVSSEIGHRKADARIHVRHPVEIYAQ